MLRLLNDISELVYIVELETYELLFVNDAGRKTFQVADYAGKKCYEVFQQLDAPCPFCTTEKLTENELYTWEYCNPVTQRHYLLKDRLDMWEGKRVRIEAAFDITDQVRERSELHNALNAERMVLNCVRCLHEDQESDSSLSSMLRQLGQELSAERAYIFAVENDRMSNTHEWCADQITPQIDSLQDMDTVLLRRWMTYFARNECMFLEKLETIRDSSPEEYAILSRQNVHSMAAVPLERDGVFIGFLGVDNPAVDKIRNIAPLLLTLQYFLAAAMRRIEDARRMEELSYRDVLTGLHNRNRYIGDLAELAHWNDRLGVVFMDLNGLKELNDRRGHAQGDAALTICARKLKEAFPQARCYRIGGDEFVAIDRTSQEDVFYAQVNTLRSAFVADGEYSTAIGARWTRRLEDIQKMAQAADTQMYEDKRKFYRSRDDVGRFRAFSTVEAADDERTQLQKYQMLMSAMNVGISKHLMQSDFPLIWANDGFYDMTGYSRAEFDAQFAGDCLSYFTDDSAEEGKRLVRLVREAFDAGKAGYETLLRVPRKDGGRAWVNLIGTFTDEQVDGVAVLYVIFSDVTDLVQLRKEQGVAYDSLPGFVFRMRFAQAGPEILYGNHSFVALYGDLRDGKAGELIQKNFARNHRVLADYAPQYRAGMPISAALSLTSIFGEEAHFQACGGCVDWIQGDPVYLFICVDITEIVNQRCQLQQLTFVDPVTHGRNRTSFELDAGGAVSASPPNSYALISLDVQKFKVINDLFGIEAGDRTLRYIYARIQSNLRPGEFVSRIAADTFNLLLRMDEPKQMKQRLQNIAADINSYNLSLARKYFLILAIGIYPIDEPALPMTQLQDRANVARKQVQRVVGSQLCVCQFYSNQDRIRMAREKDIENRMDDALKTGQFVVFYQPKLDLCSGEIVGAEALVRWQDPSAGLLPPDMFIPLFETNGFIVQLDLYVFEQACAMLRRWIDGGLLPVPISVNMSRVHLNDACFLRAYERIRQQYGLSASLLEIEVTETLIFENPQLLTEIIDEIHACGYRCSMDDFGAGYSSLSMLRNIRVDTIKLDRAFFSTALMDNPREKAVVAGVLALAKELRMTTVAEGVETECQAEFLRQAGCDLFQGYLFSRPVPGDQFEKMAFGQSL